MNRGKSTIISILILGSIVGCGNRNTALENRTLNKTDNRGTNQASYNTALRDGVYLGAGNRSSNGNEAAIVTVKGGKIVDVALKSINAEGKEINSGGTTGGTPNLDTNKIVAPGGTATGATGGGSTLAAVDQIRKDLSNAIVQKQNYDVKVDGGNMASSTVNNWILAARRAIESARR